ncbi:MAG: hypothetical protein QNJ55_34690 [Xenococcus sp. MO_188.B8]|nr:hypothetical protein [Xenococcus sp. MO_188.B8]
MSTSKPEFSADTSSVISIVTGLHSYFRDLQSYYKVLKGKLLSELEATNDEAQTEALKQKLSDVNDKMNYFHVLNNSISTVDVVLHTETMIQEFANKEKK